MTVISQSWEDNRNQPWSPHNSGATTATSSISRVASNFDQIMGILNSIDAPRAAMYEAAVAIQKLAGYGYTDSWNGNDSKGYRGFIGGYMNEVIASEKWFCNICWELKVRANKLKENEMAMAAKAANLQNGGRS